MAVVLDSSVWIALFKEDDTQHAKAEQIFAGLPSRSIIVTEYVILEVSSVLSVRAGREIADTFLEVIFSNADIEVLFSESQFFLNVVDLFRKNRNSKLSFVDVSLLLLSQSHSVITFDSRLEAEIRKNIST